MVARGLFIDIFCIKTKHFGSPFFQNQQNSIKPLFHPLFLAHSATKPNRFFCTFQTGQDIQNIDKRGPFLQASKSYVQSLCRPKNVHFKGTHPGQKSTCFAIYRILYYSGFGIN